ININFNSPDFISEVDELDKNKSYFIYCRSGARSANACMQMSTMGFTKLTNLQGGILGWTGDKE
ncbi:MAG: rhodanese-like domain-containing protein, partial [Flammeovirgaceae bacterium]